MQKKHNYEIYALLWVSNRCTRLISNLLYDLGIPNRAIERDLHLTVYYGRWPLPGLVPGYQSEHIIADSAETRFMVLAARGKSPDFSDYCSFRELTLRWSNDVSEKPKTANRAGTTSRSAPRADPSRSSGPFEPKSA